ncbi:MAG: Serine/threonine-protein kinase [Alyxoria varia]|nr:MAG: Serine/threonine-protein kinase [Alyxoria varia]
MGKDPLVSETHLDVSPPSASELVLPARPAPESSALPEEQLQSELAMAHQPATTSTPNTGMPTPPSSGSTSRSSKGQEPGQPNPGVGQLAPRSGSERPRKNTPALESVAPLSRKNTLAAKPLTTTVSNPSVHALHISNPCSVQAMTQKDLNPESQGSSVAAEKLTSSCGAQNTPPRTPRSLSIDSKPSRTASPNKRPSGPPTSEPQTQLRKTTTNDAVIGAPKGKLAVSISEGRGLRPAQAPYVVCQFQWNEYISKGPRRDSDKEDDNGNPNRNGAVPIRRTDSDMGRPMAIPMSSRQASHTSIGSRDSSRGKEVTDPIWNRDAVFDVVGDHSEVDISVYDSSRQERFLGHVRFCPNLNEEDGSLDQWFKLEPRTAEDNITGEVHIRMTFQKIDKKHYGPEDFTILKLIGKGTFGQVFQVRKKDTQRIYAMKVLSKKVIVQKKEVAHTLGERNILVRTAMAESGFIVGLKFSFQTPTDLYLVTDYMSGGELFWHLQKEGRFNEDRAKFYIAELILALQHLHHHDIVYRDLKPENILLDANGHIALCDFGLSKANLNKDDTTNTFCGTTEYLAPEVLLDENGYTKMVDFWSLGVLVFEMCCGWSPFYAEDTQQMYKNIAFGKVRFPRDALSNEGRNFVKGLLNRNPKHRLGANSDAEELKAHPFFADIDWDALAKKNVVPPFKPRLKSELDTSNFDPEFTNALNGASSLNARAAALASGVDTAATPLSPTMQANFKGFTFVDESSVEKHMRDQDVMDEDEDIPGWEHVGRPESMMSGISRTSTTAGGNQGVVDEMMFDQ